MIATLIILTVIWLALTMLAQVIGWLRKPPHEVRRLHIWTGQYPQFSAGAAFAFGLLMGHFF